MRVSPFLTCSKKHALTPPCSVATALTIIDACAPYSIVFRPEGIKIHFFLLSPEDQDAILSYYSVQGYR